MKSSGLPVVALDHLAVGDDLGAEAGGAQQRARRQADEGVAPEALAAHHDSSRKLCGCAAGQLEVQRQRRFEVGEGLGDERDAVEALAARLLNSSSVTGSPWL
jgi:hypothetical protein